MRYWKETKPDEKPEAVILPPTGYLTLSTERDLPAGISVVPVPAGALLIEDGFEAAVERMYVPFCRILSDLCGMDGRVTEVVQDSEWRLEAKAELLRAAVGE